MKNRKTLKRDNAVTFTDLANKTLLMDKKDFALLASQGESQHLAASAYGFRYQGLSAISPISLRP
jgi:hypothetical protein